MDEVPIPLPRYNFPASRIRRIPFAILNILLQAPLAPQYVPVDVFVDRMNENMVPDKPLFVREHAQPYLSHIELTTISREETVNQLMHEYVNELTWGD